MFINLFLDWTLIGWVVALAMAMSGERNSKPALPAPPASAAGEVEWLSALHESGALTDDEYQQAKRRLLGT